MKNLKIAIFDLTDCEGCELQFLALREKLLASGRKIEITNWRLANAKNSTGPFDVTFIEGSPISATDIETVKQARAVSKKVITLGTCAVLGGIQASMEGRERGKALRGVYGLRYKAKSKLPRPISYYIDVDIHLPGCPVSKEELERLLSCLAVGKRFAPASYPVCLECKAKKNACLFIEDGFCLGPVTRGGCGAVCPSGGLRCYGCFGPLEGANLGAIKGSAKHLSEEEIDRATRMFFKESFEYVDLKSKPRRKNG